MSSSDSASSGSVPGLPDTVTHLLKSIALEEEALSKIMQAEANKTMAFVGQDLDFPQKPSTADIIRFNQSVIQIMDSLLMAEWLLLKKLDTVSYMHPSLGESREPEDAPRQSSEEDAGDDYEDLDLDY